MKLRTRKSHLQTLPEGKQPQRVLPILVKYLYYLFLTAVVGGIAYLIIHKFIYYSGHGQVVVAKVSLSSTYGGIVQQLTGKAGNQFVAGEVLAVIDRGRNCIQKEPDIRLTRLLYEIKEQEAKQQVYAARMAELQHEWEDTILPRALEIGDALSRRHLETLSSELEQLRERDALIAAELAVKKEELIALRDALDVAIDPACHQETIQAPCDGTVYLVTHALHEFVAQGDPLVVFTPAEAESLIEAYFEPKLFPYLTVGKALDISFPDRSTSRGVIVELASSANVAVTRERKEYRPLEAGLRVMLKPEISTEGEKWRHFERMDVILRGRRK